MCSFRRILSRVFYVLYQLLHGHFLGLFENSDFLHHVSYKALVQVLRLFVCLKPGIDFHFYHFREFFSHLDLLSFEAIDVVSDAVLSFCNFCPQVDLLLASLQLFLLYPAIDCPKLCLHTLL